MKYKNLPQNERIEELISRIEEEVELFGSKSFIRDEITELVEDIKSQNQNIDLEVDTNVSNVLEHYNFEIQNLLTTTQQEPYKIYENSITTRDYLLDFEKEYSVNKDENIKNNILDLNQVKEKLIELRQVHTTTSLNWDKKDKLEDMKFFKSMNDTFTKNTDLPVYWRDEHKFKEVIHSFNEEEKEMFDSIIKEEELLNEKYREQEVLKSIREEHISSLKQEIDKRKQYLEDTPPRPGMSEYEMELEELEKEYRSLTSNKEELNISEMSDSELMEILSKSNDKDKVDYLLNHNGIGNFIKSKVYSNPNFKIKDLQIEREINPSNNTLNTLQEELKTTREEILRDVYDNVNIEDKQSVIDFIKLNKENMVEDYEFTSDVFNHVFTDSGLFDKYQDKNKSYEKYVYDEGWSNRLFHSFDGDEEDNKNFKEWLNYVIDCEEMELRINQDTEWKEHLDNITNEKKYEDFSSFKTYLDERGFLNHVHYQIENKGNTKYLTMDNGEMEEILASYDKEMDFSNFYKDTKEMEDTLQHVENKFLEKDIYLETKLNSTMEGDFTDTERDKEILLMEDFKKVYETKLKKINKLDKVNYEENKKSYDYLNNDIQKIEKIISNYNKKGNDMKRENIRKILRDKGLSIEGFESSGLSREDYIDKNFTKEYSNETVTKSVKVRTLNKLNEYVEVSGFEPVEKKEVVKKEVEKNYSQIRSREFVKNFSNERLEDLIDTKLASEGYRVGNNIYLDNQRRFKGKKLVGIKSKRDIEYMGLNINDNRTAYKVVERKKIYELEKDENGKFIRENGDWKYSLDENGNKIFKETQFKEKYVYDLGDTDYKQETKQIIEPEQINSDLVDTFKIGLSQNFGTNIQHRDMNENTKSYYSNGEIIINENISPRQQLEDMTKLFGNTRGLNKNETEVFKHTIYKSLGINQDNIQVNIGDKQEIKSLLEKSFSLYNKVEKDLDFDYIRKQNIEKDILNGIQSQKEEEVVFKEYDLTNKTLSEVKKMKRKTQREIVQEKIRKAQMENKEQENQQSLDFDNENGMGR